MQQNESDVVILKPTAQFLSFLDAQLPDIDLPDIRILRTDHTAYTIAKHDNDEAILDEIEHNFSFMFRHEVARLLGKDVYDTIDASFLDFLCCFKFELHSHMVVMESSMHDAHQLLCVKPRSVLLKSMQASYASSSSDEQLGGLTHVLERVSLSQLVENATVLAKNFKQLSEVKLFIQNYYRPILNAEMVRMCTLAEQWPEINSFQMFRRYFAVEIHTQLIHLD